MYTAVEGLTLSFGKGTDNQKTNVDYDQTIMKASYAIGSFTLGYSDNGMSHTTASNDQDVTSFSLGYTINDSLSVTYGEETISKEGKGTDIEVEGITASYTSGGMTVGLTSIEASNVDHENATKNNDNEFWKISLSFAF